jgi:hypothetical protein
VSRKKSVQPEPPGEWVVRASPEVEEFIRGIKNRQDFVDAQAAIETLKDKGNKLTMPISRSLGQKLYELRFPVNGSRVDQRITYSFRPQARIITLTTFRKTKDNEAKQIARARAMLKNLTDEQIEGWKRL